MAKRRSGGRFEARLEEVRAALAERAAPGAIERLRDALQGKNGYLVGVVADGLDESDTALLSELPGAFARLLEQPVDDDPGCRGKVAIAKALDRTERFDEGVFLAGVRHVQREPAWGGPVDTAAELRAVCGMALVHARHERAMVEVALRLADAETAARIGAARALAASGDRTVGEPLLRLRIAAGEPEPEVLGELFAALLELVGMGALEDLAAWMRSDDRTIAEAAAIALGGSRLPDAFAVLRDADDALFGPSRRVRLLAIALVRTPEAWAWLLEQVASGERATAEDAARALATFRHDAELCTSLRQAAAKRRDRALVRVVEEALGEG